MKNLVAVLMILCAFAAIYRAGYLHAEFVLYEQASRVDDQLAQAVESGQN